MRGATADGKMSEQTFREELQALIEAAHEAGLNINHHWACRTTAGVPDWDVEFVRLQDQLD